MDIGKGLSPKQRAHVAAGLAVLRRYSGARERDGADNLSDTELLLHRSVRTLWERIDGCLTANIELGPSILSPADMWTLDELASAIPSERETLAALRAEIARLV